MTYQIWTYIMYTAAAFGLITVLARTLFQNGSVFLADVFADKPGMAKATNQLLVIGFFMLNLGYAFLIFQTNRADDGLEALENLITKLGLLLVSFGIIHFVNMAAFWRIKRSGERHIHLPASTRISPSSPVPPQPEPGTW